MHRREVVDASRKTAIVSLLELSVEEVVYQSDGKILRVSVHPIPYNPAQNE